MKFIKCISIIFISIININYIFADGNNFKCTFDSIKKKDWRSAYNYAKKQNDPVLEKIVLSQKMLSPNYKNGSFDEITRFLYKNPYWIQSYLLKAKAESFINKDTKKRKIYQWFSKNEPITAKGYKYYAYSASKYEYNEKKKEKIIKDGWVYGNFDSAEQQQYLKRFSKYLNHANHVKKIDVLLWRGSITKAKQSMHLVNKKYQKSFEAQIALIGKKNNAKKLFKKIPEKYYTSGLIYRYLDLIKSKPPHVNNIIPLLVHAKKFDYNSAKFSKLQNYIAREYLEEKKYYSAYQVVSRSFTNNPASRSDAEFLAGWVALSFRHKPKLAQRHFTKFNNIVKTPISKSRGIYWLARSFDEEQQKDKANNLYNIAVTRYPYTFYGQMAALERNRNIKTFPVKKSFDSTKVSAKAKELAKAVKIVSKYGNNSLSEIYIKEAISQVKNENEVKYIAKQLGSNKNTYHNAWFAKFALHKHVLLTDYAYPMPYKLSNLPIEDPLVYSIIRQESVFNKYAVSSAKAKGLMQLMNGTACETAKKIGVSCSIPRLTRDVSYNIKLGSNHLKHVLDRYDNSYVLTIAAYNAGAHNADKWIKRYGDPRNMKNIKQVINWMEMIPFYETRNYVQRVLENLQIYRMMLKTNSKFNKKNNLLLHGGRKI